MNITNRLYDRILERKNQLLSELPKSVRDSIIQEELRKQRKKEEYLKRERERKLTKKEWEMVIEQMKLIKESIEYEKKMEQNNQDGLS